MAKPATRAELIAGAIEAIRVTHAATSGYYVTALREILHYQADKGGGAMDIIEGMQRIAEDALKVPGETNARNTVRRSDRDAGAQGETEAEAPRAS